MRLFRKKPKPSPGLFQVNVLPYVQPPAPERWPATEDWREAWEKSNAFEELSEDAKAIYGVLDVDSIGNKAINELVTAMMAWAMDRAGWEFIEYGEIQLDNR